MNVWNLGSAKTLQKIRCRRIDIFLTRLAVGSRAILALFEILMIVPSTISRFVFFELSKIFLVTLTALVSLLVLVGVLQESIRNGLPPVVALRILPYILPNALCFAMPGAVLFSACSVYGQMSANNEITALKSAGISPSVVLRPVLVLALLLSLGTVWLIDVAFSWGYAGVQRVITSSVEEIAYAMLSSHKSFRSDRFSIHVEDVNERRLIGPTITIHGEGGAATTTITAREASIDVDPNQGGLRLKLTDGFAKVDNQFALRFTDSIEYLVHLDDGSHDQSTTANPSHLRLAQIPTATIQQQAAIRQLEASLAAEAAMEMITGDFDSLSGPAWKDKLQGVTNQKNRLYRLETEPHRRWASGFSCFCFALIGAPLAIRLRTSDLLTSFGICFLPILLIYYPFFAFGLDRAKSGTLPPQSVWLANIVCLGLGIWLFRNVLRH